MADQCSDSPHRVQEAAGGCMPLRRLAGSSLWQLTCYNPRWDDSNYHRWTSWFKDLGCCDEQLGQQFIVMKQAFGILSPWRYKTKGIAAVTLKVILWGALTIFRSEGGHVCGVSSQFPRGGVSYDRHSAEWLWPHFTRTCVLVRPGWQVWMGGLVDG